MKISSRCNLIVSYLFVHILHSEAKSKSKDDRFELDESKYGVKAPTKCEVCKIVTTELEHQLNTKFKTGGKLSIDTGYNYLQENETNKKKTMYDTSMIRLQEALEATCGTILRDYNVHKNRKDWKRFARGEPSKPKEDKKKPKKKKTEIEEAREAMEKHRKETQIRELKSQCDHFIETFEQLLEHWYQKKGGENMQSICTIKLGKKDPGCVSEKVTTKDNPVNGKSGEKKRKGEL